MNAIVDPTNFQGLEQMMKTVTVSHSDLARLVEFAKCLESSFNELSTLFSVVAEKSGQNWTAKNLAHLGTTHANNWSEYCSEESELLARLDQAMND